MTYDLAVIGAGPAGASATIEAAKAGLDTVLIDEQRAAGGQVWRAKGPAIKAAPATPEGKTGDRLRAALAAVTADRHFSARVWDIERHTDGFRISAISPTGALTIETRAVLLAGGAQERVFAVPGWTLPGVIGLGAATALMKEQLVLPGNRVIVAGVGPLLSFVAHEIIRNGGKVAAVVDLNPLSVWLRCLPDLIGSPGLLVRGAWWRLRLWAAGVAYFHECGIRSIEGDRAVSRVTIGAVDANWCPLGAATQTYDADAVCLGHGLAPATEASRLLGADHQYDGGQGGWKPVTDDVGRTTVPGLFVAGDGAGVQGAAAAQLQGRISALAIAEDLGLLTTREWRRRSAPLILRIGKAQRFGRAMTALTIPRPGLIEAIAPDTLVCRCEGLSRHDIEAEIRAGANWPNAIKSGTRCGMGPCGGRYCTETVTELACRITGKTPGEFGIPTARPPLRPVPIGCLSGEFDYDDLPIPPPAPL